MHATELSEEHLSGQRLMIGFDGTEIDADLRFLIDTLKIGGIILFSRNIESSEQIRRLTQSVQDHAGACGLPPLFISIDQEGGQVARLKPPFTQFPGNPRMTGDADAARFAEVTASELSGIGINMNMAPVLDVAPEGFQSVMADRVFGHDPQWVARLGGVVIQGLQRRNVMAVAKHFPGIGRTRLDSHMDLPDLDIDPGVLMDTDLVPFRAAVAQGVSGIMLSHIRYPKIDPRWPASLSRAIAKDLLRGHVGYTGVVITDDLDMGAIEKHYDIRAAIGQVLWADIDIALICHRSPKIETACEEIRRRLRDSTELRDRGLNSARRILSLKERFMAQSAGRRGRRA